VDERLLVTCTRALLEGWCGPVHGLVHNGVPVRAVSIGDFTGDGRAMLWTDVGDWLMFPGDLSLDLSRAECRDRVLRVLALAAMGARARAGTAAPDWYWCDDVDGTDVPEWTPSQGGDLLRWYLPTAPASDHEVHVPSLAVLNPNDDTRLPDGGRLVDALALAAVWREVSR